MLVDTNDNRDVVVYKVNARNKRSKRGEEDRTRTRKKREIRSEIFRSWSATYHEVVNSTPTFPREIIIFPLVKSDSVTLMRAYIRREK